MPASGFKVYCVVLQVVLQIPPTRAAWEFVYNLYNALGLLSAIVAFAVILVLAIRYRARGKTISPTDERAREDRDAKWKGPALVYVLMAIVLITVAAQSFATYGAFSTVPATPNTLTIDVIGHQFAWTFVYPNGFVSESLAVVPTDTVVVFNVTSKDVYHQFGIPYFRVKTDALPGRTNLVWIETTDAGNFTVQCFELCGVGHATMIATLAVVPPTAYSQWYASTTGGGS
jgi:cytochrome c oxidase subunit 2